MSRNAGWIAVVVVACATLGACSSAGGSTAPSPDAAYYGGTVLLGPPNGQSTLSLSKIDDVKQVNGVKTAFPVYRFDAKTGLVERPRLTQSDAIVASDPTEAAWSSLKTDYAEGHAIDADSSGEVVLGSAIAKELGKATGDKVSLPLSAGGPAPSRPFTVVGVLRVTGTAPDRTAYINITDGQALLKDTLPAPERDQVDATTVATGIDVYGKPGASVGDLDKLADEINRQVTGVVATRPSQLLNLLQGQASA